MHVSITDVFATNWTAPVVVIDVCAQTHAATMTSEGLFHPPQNAQSTKE